jgi:hypothetical protein
MRFIKSNRCLRALLCLGLLLSYPCEALGLTIVHGPHVTPGETTASIIWKTDVEAGTRVQYGTHEKLLDQRASGGVGADHRIDLKGLQPGTLYYFSVGSARVLLGQGSFQTAGKSAPAEAPKRSVGTSVMHFFSALLAGNETEKSAAAKSAPPSQAAPPSVLTAPPPHETWRQLDTLEDHYDRHGADFNSVSKDHYATQAWLFLQRTRQNSLPMKWDEADNTLRVWEPKTRTFAAYDGRGRTRTFFKPSNPDYWNRQPGRSIKPSELAFK